MREKCDFISHKRFYLAIRFVDYITDRTFRMKQEEVNSEPKEIEAGIPQGCVVEPVLYLIYTSDIPGLIIILFTFTQ